MLQESALISLSFFREGQDERGARQWVPGKVLVADSEDRVTVFGCRTEMLMGGLLGIMSFLSFPVSLPMKRDWFEHIALPLCFI